MRKRNLLVAIVASLLTLPACTNLARENEGEEKEEGNEVKVKMDQVPAAARKTLEEQGKGGAWEDIAKVSEDGKTVYEGDVKVDGKEYEIRVAEDGKLLSKKAESDDEKGGEDKEDDEEEKK